MPTLSWIIQFGTSAGDEANDIATDQRGNIIVCGATSGVMVEEDAKGKEDAFLAKYDASGRQQWIRQFGRSGSDKATAVTTDHFNNIFVSGYRGASIEGGQGTGIFLAKYAPDGNQEWTKLLGDEGKYLYPGEVAVDQMGNVLITGGRKKNDSNYTIAFLAKYSTDGIKQWEIEEESWNFQYEKGKTSETGVTLALDRRGNIFLGGITNGVMQLSRASVKNDAFLAKYRSNGSKEWLRQYSTGEYESVVSVATDQWGNAFLCGNTRGKMNRGQAKGKQDSFLIKCDTTGKKIWVKQLGTASDDTAKGLTVDQWGQLFMCGNTYGELEKGQQKGGSDLTLMKLNNEGEEIWVKQLGGSSVDRFSGVVVNQWGHIFVAGTTGGEIVRGDAKGKNDAVLAKFLDDLDPTQRHEIEMNRFDQLEGEITKLKEQLLSQKK